MLADHKATNTHTVTDDVVADRRGAGNMEVPCAL